MGVTFQTNRASIRVNANARFQAADAFSADQNQYQLAPFRFGRIPNVPGKVLVVNEVGEFAFLTESDFGKFHGFQLDHLSPVYRDLRSKHFLLDEYAEAYWPLAVSQYRTRKSLLVGGPALHIVVVTLRCDHSCPYCQVSRQTPDVDRFDMTAESAKHVVNRILESPAADLKVEFQGGESLFGFERIRQITLELVRAAPSRGKRIEFVVASTLGLLTADQLAFLKEHRFNVSTSVDGPAWLHNRNRPKQGKNSFELTVAGIERARSMLGAGSVSALVTLTRDSLDHPEEIIDTYVDLGFSSIFLRPLSQYGFAKKTNGRLGYSQLEFLDFYERAFEHLLELNRSGVQMEEVYASILMRKILTPYASGYVDLASPTGAMLGTLVYNYDGDVYAADEGRMLAEIGDRTFKLGTVAQARDELYRSDAAKKILAASVAEALPICSDCVFVPYCGADPVGNYAETGRHEGDRRMSAFCQRQTSMFRMLFTHLADLSSEKAQMLSSWAFGKAYEPGRKHPSL